MKSLIEFSSNIIVAEKLEKGPWKAFLQECWSAEWIYEGLAADEVQKPASITLTEHWKS